MTLVVKSPPTNAGDVRCRFYPWVKKIPGIGKGYPLWYSCMEDRWTEEPVWLQSLGSRRIGYDWSDLVHALFYAEDSLCSKITFFPRFHCLSEVIIKCGLWSSVRLLLLEAPCWEIPNQGPLVLYVAQSNSQTEHMNRMLGQCFTAYFLVTILFTTWTRCCSDTIFFN